MDTERTGSREGGIMREGVEGERETERGCQEREPLCAFVKGAKAADLGAARRIHKQPSWLGQ